jgi:hypothetical protein
MNNKQINLFVTDQEQGQTIVLFALMLIALLAFVGIATDVGMGFVRSSQFSAAVDAAALAGVIDLDPESETNTQDADRRAAQFLGANGWPLDSTAVFTSSRSYTDEGIPQYAITVTWQVETYFMRIFNISGFPVTRTATAAYFAQAEIITASAYERSHIRKTSQFVFGPESCTSAGDPVSPLYRTPGVHNPDHALADGVFRYRFRIPANYEANNETSLVRVELFDTDAWNNPATQTNIYHSNSYSATHGSVTPNVPCNTGMGQRCVLPTNEEPNATTQNPFWFVRVDETWDGGCVDIPGNNEGNTETEFELYYYNDLGQRISVALYHETNDNVALTDLQWVSPGAPSGGVGANAGSFEVDSSVIPIGLGNARYLYMDVRTVQGNSKNVFDVHAGLPGSELPVEWTLFRNVNDRNLYLANNPTFDPSGGVQTFALGRMPVQHYYANAPVMMPLAPVDTLLVGGAVYATIFDHDANDSDPNTNPPEIQFSIDVVATFDFYMLGKVTNEPGPPPDRVIFSQCNEDTTCNNEWIWPQFRMGVPAELYMPGTLYAQYTPRQDAHTWWVSITAGRPVLKR